MAKNVYTTSEEGFASTTEAGDDRITIDATGETSADTLEYLLASYASCYVPALRVAAEQRDVGDLGAIEIAVTGDLNESDKLDAIAFEATTDADVDASSATALRERADELCKVHDALKGSLEAHVTIDGHAP